MTYSTSENTDTRESFGITVNLNYSPKDGSKLEQSISQAYYDNITRRKANNTEPGSPYRMRPSQFGTGKKIPKEFR